MSRSHLIEGVVHREGRPHRGRDTEAAMQRRGAVVTDPYRPLVVENLTDVVGVHTVDHERRRRAVPRIARADDAHLRYPESPSRVADNSRCS